MALQSPQPVLQLPPWMWPFGVACPTEPRGKPHTAGLRLRGRAHGHPLPWLAMWEWLWAWAPGGVSIQLTQEPTLPPGCFVWLWGSWIGPQISRMTGMTLRSRVCPVLQVCGWAHHPGSPGVTGGRGVPQLEFGRGPLGAMPGGSPAQRVSSLSIPAPELFFFCPGSRRWAASHTQAHVSICLLSPGRRNLWLNIGGKEAAALSMFHVSVPLPGVSGGVTGQGSCSSLASA